MSPKADLALLNANILTMDTMEPRRPTASAVAVGSGRVLALGRDKGELAPFLDSRARVVDCQGMTLTPGFHDAHCHLPAMASRLLDLDCGPEKAASIAGIKELIGKQARETPPGRWIRAFGYDESLLAEGRPPDRRDLDEAAPCHPVRLARRAGHALVLNSRAMGLLGINRDTVDPPSGVIVREAETGHPTGLFLEMSAHVRSLMAPYRRRDEFMEGVARAGKLLLSRGVTSIQDAGANNGPEQWQTFRDLKESGRLTPRVTMMTSPESRGPGSPRRWPTPPTGGLRLGAAKIMVTLTTGSLRPSPEELEELALDLHRRGVQMAFHAVESEAITAVAQAISRARRLYHRPDPRHRVEHCSEGLPQVLRAVKESGALVVTQPGFVYHNGAKYLERVDASLLPHLYPLASLPAAGIPWAAGSDAPVAPAHPLLDVHAAVNRRTADGRPLGLHQAVSVWEALRAWTTGPAYAGFMEEPLGTIKAGALADLVLLDRDPTRVEPHDIKNVRVVMTIAGGRVVWEA